MMHASFGCRSITHAPRAEVVGADAVDCLAVLEVLMPVSEATLIMMRHLARLNLTGWVPSIQVWHLSQLLNPWSEELH
jgi:hypothetical protein